MTTVIQRIAGLFHLGRIPADIRTRLESEGRILYIAEGIWETAVFKNFKTPGSYCGYRCISFIGFFALSEKRIIAKAKFHHDINVNATYDNPQFQSIAFIADTKMLSLAIDVSAQSPQMSGLMEVRLHLQDVDMAVQILQGVGARIEHTNR